MKKTLILAAIPATLALALSLCLVVSRRAL